MDEIRDMNELYRDIVEWAREREIDKADPRNQYLKVSEETGELAASLARNDLEQAKDDIGDSIVTLIIAAETIGSNAQECLNIAFNEIKNRTGKTVDGIFIKDE